MNGDTEMMTRMIREMAARLSSADNLRSFAGDAPWAGEWDALTAELAGVVDRMTGLLERVGSAPPVRVEVAGPSERLEFRDDGVWLVGSDGSEEIVAGGGA